jgi:hypothetical protein
MMSELVIEPWTNDIGQTINPGDEVIFAGTSWKQTYIRKGVFAGVRYDNVTRTNYLKDENGNYIKEERTNVYNGTTYYVNKTERVTSREVVAVRVEKVNRGKKWVYNNDGKYVKSEEDIYGVSTLPLKRVYKIDTSLAAAHKVA